MNTFSIRYLGLFDTLEAYKEQFPDSEIVMRITVVSDNAYNEPFVLFYNAHSTAAYNAIRSLVVEYVFVNGCRITIEAMEI
jgi:hypothetical protein